MRILFLRPKIEIGGVTTLISLLGSELMERGNTVLTATSGGGGLQIFRERHLPFVEIPLYPSTPATIGKSVRKLCELIRSSDIDVLHSHHRYSTIIAYLSGLLEKKPTVATIHEGFLYGRDWFGLSSLWRGDFATVPSLALKNHLVRNFRIPTDRIKCVPNAVTLSDGWEEDGSALRQNYAPGADKVVLFVGRLSAEKGVQILIEAIPRVDNGERVVMFLIVGDGPERNRLENLARELGIKQRVVFLGFRRDIATLMSAADLLVVPSLSDSSSMVALEAMSVGLPVVAADVGGLPEVVREGTTGLLFRTGNAVDLSDKVSAILSNRGMRERFGCNSRRVVRENHSISLMADEYIELYDRILSERSIRPSTKDK